MGNPVILLDKLKQFDIESEQYHASDLIHFNLNLSSLFRFLDKRVYAFIIEDHVLDHWVDNYSERSAFRKIQKMLPTIDKRSRLTLLFSFLNKSNPKFLAFKQILSTNSIPLISIHSVLTSNKDIGATLKLLLLNHSNLKIDFLNPYDPFNTPKNRMFFGRKELIDKVLGNNSNLVIVGPRRIGKTSLVKQVQKTKGYVIEKFMSKSEFYQYSYVDLRISDGILIEELCESIIEGFELDISLIPGARKRIDKDKDLFEYNNRGALVYLIDKYLGELTIILDEIDNWLSKDEENGWTCLNFLRSICDKGKAKMILVGYEGLDFYLSQDKFPFYGRTKRIFIEPLDRDGIAELVRQPLEELNLNFENLERAIYLIWYASSGRPNVVHDICIKILELLFTRNQSQINESIINTAVKGSEQITNLIKSVFYLENSVAKAIYGISAMHKTVKSELYIISKISEIDSVDHEDSNIIKRKLIHEHLKLSRKISPIEIDKAFLSLEIRYLISPSGLGYNSWRLTNNGIRVAVCQQILNFPGLLEGWLDYTLNLG